jgi:hypothetical protein
MIIQARIRGSLSRESAELVEAIALQEQRKAAALVQAMVRGFIAREILFFESAAATMIQAHVRRMAAEALVVALQKQMRRKARARAKAEREAQEHFRLEAARRIQQEAEEQAQLEEEERRRAEAEEKARRRAEEEAEQHFKQAQEMRLQEKEKEAKERKAEEKETRKRRFKVQVMSATKLVKVGLFGKSDPYAAVHVVPASHCNWASSPAEVETGGLDKAINEVGGTLMGKTNVVKKSLAPEWNSENNTFVSDTPAADGALVVEVWDAGDTFLGEVAIRGSRITEMLAKKRGRSEMTKLLKPKAGAKEKKWNK